MTRTSSGSRDAEAREARAPHAHAEPTAPAQGGVVEGGVRVGVGITFGQFHKDHMPSGALYVKQLQDQGSAKESGIVFKGDILFEVCVRERERARSRRAPDRGLIELRVIIGLRVIIELRVTGGELRVTGETLRCCRLTRSLSTALLSHSVSDRWMGWGATALLSTASKLRSSGLSGPQVPSGSLSLL